MMIQAECGLSEWSAADYSAEVRRTDAITMVARGSYDELFGFITGRLVGLADVEAEIYNIGVREHLRCVGVGSALLKCFLHEARKRSARRVWLDVRESNTIGKSFYSAHGFTVAGKRKMFYSTPVEDAEIMVRELGPTSREQSGEGA